MGWVMIYRAVGAADVYLVRDFLVGHGIVSELRGELLQGLGGGIPIPDAMPQLWVARQDAAQALELVKAYQKPVEPGPEWTCSSCGERHAAVFSQCWNCVEVASGVDEVMWSSTGPREQD
jgi:hypothetical protein